MRIRRNVKRLFPPSWYNRLMLTVPAIYNLPLVDYETNMDRDGLDDLYSLIYETAKCPGDIVECGSSRCGGAILMARHLRGLGIHKKVYALDSFEGFPKAEFEREKSADSRRP